MGDATFEIDLVFYTLPFDDYERKIIRATFTISSADAFSAVAIASQCLDGPYEVEVEEVRRRETDGSKSVLDII